MWGTVEMFMGKPSDWQAVYVVRQHADGPFWFQSPGVPYMFSSLGELIRAVRMDGDWEYVVTGELLLYSRAQQKG